MNACPVQITRAERSCWRPLFPPSSHSPHFDVQQRVIVVVLASRCAAGRRLGGHGQLVWRDAGLPELRKLIVSGDGTSVMV
jgi:hypothetical protein